MSYRVSMVMSEIIIILSVIILAELFKAWEEKHILRLVIHKKLNGCFFPD